MSDREFEHKTALVTGGSRGIGREIAIALARAGARVAVNYAASDEAARATEHAIEAEGAKAAIFKADVANEKAVSAMVADIEQRLGPIDLLVTSAGVALIEDHAQMTHERWRRVMDTNVDGTYLPIMAVKDGMIARGTGSIVCIGSIAGLRPRGRMVAYATSKAAVIAMARSFAEALAPEIRVNAVAPGLIDTDMTADMDAAMKEAMVAQTFLKRSGRPDDIADAVMFLLSHRARFVTGQTLVADGGRVTLP